MGQQFLDLGEQQGPIGSVEQALKRHRERWVIGVDEAGRGPLAGPVSVAAVLFDLEALEWVDGLNDSKQLSAERREALYEQVRACAPAARIVQVSAAEVDVLNILWASMEGMRRAVEALRRTCAEAHAALVLVDGKVPIPKLAAPQTCLVKGDARSLAIAAASILAKVTRDRTMVALDARYPGYGFARHKGYPTAQHRAALQALGPCPQHRRSFRGVTAPSGEG